MRSAGVGVLRVEVTDDITGEMAAAITRAVAAYPGRSIEIEIDTPGGDWSASRSIFETLQHHGRRVTALIQRAASGGALIAMSADHRQMHPTGHFFLHRPSGAYTKATLDGIADRKAALMAGRCRIPAARIRRWMDENTTLDAGRALSVGLVDEVPGLPKPRHPIVFL